MELFTIFMFIIIIALSITIIITRTNIIQNMCLYFMPFSYCINNYKNIEKKYDQKIVVSIYATKDNINDVYYLIKNILQQTTRIDQVALNVHDDSIVPKEYKDVCIVYKIGSDYGKMNNLIPTLLREGETDTIIIALNLDDVYDTTFIEDIINESNNKKAVLSDKAILIQPGFINEEIIKETDPQNLKKYLNVDITYI